MVRLFFAVAYLMFVQPLVDVRAAIPDTAEPCVEPLARFVQDAPKRGLTMHLMLDGERDAFVRAYGAPPVDGEPFRMVATSRDNRAQVLIVVGNCIVGQTGVFPYDVLESILGRRVAK